MLVAAAPSAAAAQGDVTVRAGQANWGAGHSTVTAPFFVAHARADELRTVQLVDLPKDWQLLMGETPLAIPAGESAMFMVGAAVPARAAAGGYVIRVRVLDMNARTLLGADSILVMVPRRRALEVSLVDRPGYVVAGKSYDAGFLVRNRGNAPTDVVLRAQSTLGVATLNDTSLHLAAEESRVVRARVRAPVDVDAAIDDVLELHAAEVDTAVNYDASARVTVVPEPDRKIEQYVRVPTQVRLRAATTEGVSPYEVFGRGPVRDGGDARLDFLFRGPAGDFAVFGDRDEYRAELSARSWRVRGGDHLYLLSPLTSSATPGFGAGAEGSVGAFSAGGYAQQFRRQPQGGAERGAFLSAWTMGDALLAANFVDRTGGLLPGRIGSATMKVQRPTFTADAEIARSHGVSGWGIARSARVAGATPVLTYDLGHLFADSAFAGSQRAAEHNYMTATARAGDLLSFGLNASAHRADLSRAAGVPYADRLDVGNVSATLANRVTLETGIVERTVISPTLRDRGQQNTLRAHVDQEVRVATLSVEGEVGRVSGGDARRHYTDALVGLRRTFSYASVGGWLARYSGGSITKGAEGTDTYGGDVSLQLPRNFEVTAMGFATRMHVPLAEWHSQIDGQVTHLLRNGTTISLRARVLGGGAIPASEQSVAYLEYGMPLRLPIAPLRSAGRVRGHLVDAASGKGISGALVRLGPQVAITDKSGRVAFGGVPAGEYRLSMTQETSYANAVFVGDPTLRIDSTQRHPTTFQLAIAQGARVDVDVRRFVAVKTGVAQAADSLADAGALEDITLMLVSGRDTLYETTAPNGRASFSEVPPGHWVLVVKAEAPAFQRFDPDRTELDLASGETRAVAFRLVPRKREIQIIGEGEELRAKPSAPPSKPRRNR
jgi:hypothetical protein